MKELYNQNPENVLAVIREITQEDNNIKAQMVNGWKRNIYFTNGLQGLTSTNSFVVESNNGQLVSHGQANRKHAYNTNEIYQLVRTLVSYMTRAKPSVDVVAADKTERSKLSSQMVEKIIDAKWELDCEQAISRQAAYWGLCTGTVFRKDWWDYTLGYDVKVPVLDEMGNYVLGEDGQPVYNDSSSGNNNIAIKTGFSVGLDISATTMQDTNYIFENYLADVQWIREAFSQNLPGFTGNAERVNADGSIALSLQTLEELKTAAPGTRTMGGFTPSRKDKAMVTEFYIKPNRDYPQGRLFIIANDMVLFDSVSPYVFQNMQQIWHPYTPWVFEPFIGRLYGKSLIEDLVAPQMRLNELNGSILENANTVAKVDVLVSDLAKMKQGIFAGGGGRVYAWSGIGPEPKKWQGVPLPDQFFKERQEIIDGMVRRSGTNFVMSGAPPTGVTAAAALELLLQNATSQQSDTMNTWEKFHEQGQNMKVNVIKKFGQYPDHQLKNYLMNLTGDALNEQVREFVGSDIGDGITVRIEPGSMIPKMEKFKRDTLMELLKGGALGPVAEDSPRGAVLREKVQKEMGIFDLDLEDSKDVEKAKWENGRISLNEMPDPQPYDNHDIHIYVLLTLMKDPLYIEKASPKTKMKANEHLAWHQEQKAMQQQQQMMQQMAAQMPMEQPQQVLQ